MADILETNYIEIGLTEFVQQWMSRIAARLGFPFTPAVLGHDNATERDKQVSVELREEFRARHELEYLVYDYVRSRYIKL